MYYFDRRHEAIIKYRCFIDKCLTYNVKGTTIDPIGYFMITDIHEDSLERLFFNDIEELTELLFPSNNIARNIAIKAMNILQQYVDIHSEPINYE